MAQLPAFAVDGGTVPAAMARRMTYAVSGSANGIVSPQDFKVTALPTAGSAVQIARGSALCRARTTGANEFETYVISQDSTLNLSIPATGGSARTDYVIARVMDWHFTGDPAPANPTTALYWEVARVGTTEGITTPFVELARLRIPANTSVITDAMITDRRNVAIPLTERHQFVHRVNSEDYDALSQSVTQTWPDVFENQVFIPEWATHAYMVGTFAQVYFPEGDFKGTIFASLGNAGPFTQDVLFESPPTASRQTIVAAGKVFIPEAQRGAFTTVKLRGRKLSGTTLSAPVLRSGSAVVLEIDFLNHAS